MKKLSTQLFHLWGAKDFYDKASEDNNQKLFQWDRLKKDLISTNDEFIKYLGKQEYFDILEKLKNIVEKYQKGLINFIPIFILVIKV